MTHTLTQRQIVLVDHERPDVCLQIYRDRWADLQLDGTIQAVDEGIDFMIRRVSKATHSRDCQEIEYALDDIEGSAFATARRLRWCLALDPNRPVTVPLAVAKVLHTAVSQYVQHLARDVSAAILAGVALATACRADTLAIKELSGVERGYVAWVIPRLMRHLIYEPYEGEAEDSDVE